MVQNTWHKVTPRITSQQQHKQKRIESLIQKKIKAGWRWLIVCNATQEAEIRESRFKDSLEPYLKNTLRKKGLAEWLVW
jgi:hypothetical protein